MTKTELAQRLMDDLKAARAAQVHKDGNTIAKDYDLWMKVEKALAQPLAILTGKPICILCETLIEEREDVLISSYSKYMHRTHFRD